MINVLDIIDKQIAAKHTYKGLTLVLNTAPTSLITRTASAVLNNALRASINDGEFDFLIDKVLAMQIKDTSLTLYFSFDENTQKICVKGHKKPDEEMSYHSKLSGNLSAFISLLGAQKDPDTLFFNRHLVILGDTELSLTLKNLLDSLDPKEIIPAHLYTPVMHFSKTLNQSER